AANEFEQVVEKELKGKTEEGKRGVNNGVGRVGEEGLENGISISEETYESMEGIIGEVERKVCEEINVIVDDEDLEKLEGEWGGVDDLVRKRESDSLLKMKVLGICKKEVGGNLKGLKGSGW
ncbi:type VI secretion system contractile sheath domain-containing protein, partial [Neisseria sicca]|uniref:type VI secretion system contractile sheath domain-containing protein n=1 Tax=Neisseria sicca TaxID=490 RepID=UPI001649A2B1